jgi:hypothetical protein
MHLSLSTIGASTRCFILLDGGCAAFRRDPPQAQASSFGGGLPGPRCVCVWAPSKMWVVAVDSGADVDVRTTAGLETGATFMRGCEPKDHG